jgi:hypothetical protein
VTPGAWADVLIRYRMEEGITPMIPRRMPPFRSLSLFGISRRSGFRAVRDSALSGISRRLGFRAVRHLAPLLPCAVSALGHWRDGPAGTYQMGIRHGIYCLGCYWALMAVLFAVGVMNLAWVGALTVFILLERIGRQGALVARVGGMLMIALGAFTLYSH